MPSNPKFTVKLSLQRARGDEGVPDLALYALDARGRPTKKLAAAKNGKLSLDISLKKSRTNVAVGPDVSDLKDLEGAKLMTMRAKELSSGLEIPHAIWWPWPGFRECVTGSVRWCKKFFPPIGPLIPDLPFLPDPFNPTPKPILPIQICQPICDGVVEIYEKTCCCDIIFHPWPPFEPWPPIDICKRYPKLCEPIEFDPPWPPRPPRPPIVIDPPIGPFPGPRPGPDPIPWERGRLIDPTFARKLKVRNAEIEPADMTPLSSRVVSDLMELKSVPKSEMKSFFQDRPHLHHLLCSCKMRKIGEAIIQPDGSFSFCFWKFPILNLLRTICSTTYTYKVKQWIQNQWVEIYDGEDAHEYFTADEEAVLSSFSPDAIPCTGDPGPEIDHDKPYVALFAIGSTHQGLLNSPLQQDTDGIDTPLAVDDGLLSKGLGGGHYASFTDCPWAKTLGFRLDITEGMKTLGAKYYRFSKVKADSNGNPLGGATPMHISNGVSWRKNVQQSDGTWAVQHESLGPVSVGAGANTVQNLYKIPYRSEENWWPFQAHQTWNTENDSSDRYLILVEVFDAGGNRLKPNGAQGAGTQKNFDFLHFLSTTQIATVDYAALNHVFRIDNHAVGGDLVDLRHNGIASNKECNFFEGGSSDTFSVGFKAYHTNTPANGGSFMGDWHLYWNRGLNGAGGTLDSGTTNQGDATTVVPSDSMSFQVMLGYNPLDLIPRTKCSFAVRLHIHAKHTNGSRRIHEYDYYETAAFALEIV